MERNPVDLNRAEAEKEAIEALKAELEQRAKSETKAFTKPFVAHGKAPSPPPSGP